MKVLKYVLAASVVVLIAVSTVYAVTSPFIIDHPTRPRLQFDSTTGDIAEITWFNDNAGDNLLLFVHRDTDAVFISTPVRFDLDAPASSLRLEANGDLTLGRDLSVGQDVSVTRDASIGQDLLVTGGGTVSVDLSVGQDLTVTRDGSVGQDLSIGRDLVFSNSGTTTPAFVTTSGGDVILRLGD